MYPDPLTPIKSSRALWLLVLAAVALVTAFAKPPQAAVQQQPGLYKVTKVIDGDTIEVEQDGQKETVRLIGVDTPETQDPRRPVQCFGSQARAYTERLAAGMQVRMEADPLDNNRDKYRRLLRYVYLPDGTNLNARIIQDGYGFAYTSFDFTKKAEFVSLQQTARQQNLGLWAGCQVEEGSRLQTNPAG